MPGETPAPQPPAPTGGEFDYLLDKPGAVEPTSVEDAAVRPETQAPTAADEVERQAGIAAADRKLRKESGQQPPVADLR